MYSKPVPISSAHEVRDFDCGNAALNEYLVKFAITNASAGMARTFVTTHEDQPAVVGYFSITAGSIESEAATERVAKGIPKHAIPVALLARLAVDLKHQGRGLGKGLLQQALLKILAASSTIGIRAVLVHAKDQQAADFYAKYGFVPSPTNKFHLLLILKDIAKIAGTPGPN